MQELRSKQAQKCAKRLQSVEPPELAAYFPARLALIARSLGGFTNTLSAAMSLDPSSTMLSSSCWVWMSSLR